jgi:hypothetical protein
MGARTGTALDKDMCNFCKPLILRRQMKWSQPIAVLGRYIDRAGVRGGSWSRRWAWQTD